MSEALWAKVAVIDGNTYTAEVAKDSFAGHGDTDKFRATVYFENEHRPIVSERRHVGSFDIAVETAKAMLSVVKSRAKID